MKVEQSIQGEVIEATVVNINIAESLAADHRDCLSEVLLALHLLVQMTIRDILKANLDM